MTLYNIRLAEAKKFADWTGRHKNVLMVALTGSMATGKIKPSSDIDFFIQVNSGRLWTTRFWITLFATLAGGRPSRDNKAGKICLNWWGTENLPQKRAIQYQILYKNLSKRRSLKPHWLEKFLKILQTERLKSDSALKKGLETKLSDRELAIRHQILTKE